ncbi:hypothetical protein EE612_033521, partial [Oryza sativa]
EAGRSDAGILSSGRCDAGVPLSSILSAGEPSMASSGGGCERATTLLLPHGSGRHERREKGRNGDRRRDLGSSPPSTAARAPSPSAAIIRYRRRHSGSSPPSGLVAATRACHRHPLSLGLRPHSSQPLPAVAAADSSRAGSTGREKSISNVGPMNAKAIWAGQNWPLREEFGQSFGLALLVERLLE